jgi:hypothetical protein
VIAYGRGCGLLQALSGLRLLGCRSRSFTQLGLLPGRRTGDRAGRSASDKLSRAHTPLSGGRGLLQLIHAQLRTVCTGSSHNHSGAERYQHPRTAAAPECPWSIRPSRVLAVAQRGHSSALLSGQSSGRRWQLLASITWRRSLQTVLCFGRTMEHNPWLQPHEILALAGSGCPNPRDQLRTWPTGRRSLDDGKVYCVAQANLSTPAAPHLIVISMYM